MSLSVALASSTDHQGERWTVEIALPLASLAERTGCFWDFWVKESKDLYSRRCFPCVVRPVGLCRGSSTSAPRRLLARKLQPSAVGRQGATAWTRAGSMQGGL